MEIPCKNKHTVHHYSLWSPLKIVTFLSSLNGTVNLCLMVFSWGKPDPLGCYFKPRIFFILLTQLLNCNLKQKTEQRLKLLKLVTHQDDDRWI